MRLDSRLVSAGEGTPFGDGHGLFLQCVRCQNKTTAMGADGQR